MLVKGLDLALLEQARARAAADTGAVDDETLEVVARLGDELRGGALHERLQPHITAREVADAARALVAGTVHAA